MKLYYQEELDCLCIVDGKKIWKYIGEFTPQCFKLTFVVGKWYRAKNSPVGREGFTFLGEI